MSYNLKKTSNKMINDLKKVFKESLGVNVTIKKSKNSSNSDVMNKLLFVEVIRILKQVASDTEYLRDEIGIDLSGIEDQYYLAIDNLLRMNFNESQVSIIQYYVYEMPNDGEFEGKMEVKEKSKVTTHPFKTPEDLWEILKVVK
jgi:hypothetical protein